MAGTAGGAGGGSGVQNERTALAWQRTALSLAAAEAALARLTYDRAPILSTVSLVVILPLTAWVFAASRRRYAAQGRRAHSQRAQAQAQAQAQPSGRPEDRGPEEPGPEERGPEERAPAPGGVSAAVLAAVVALMAVTELAALLSGPAAG
jgi:hypothetical protein